MAETVVYIESEGRVVVKPTEILRLAILSPIAWRTPPVSYGPWELFASLLAEGLVALGHDVTLFATAHSLTKAKLRSSIPMGWSEDSSIDAKVAECTHIASVFERAQEFDIIHNGFDFLPLTYTKLVSTPVVTTIHGFSSPDIVPVYERYNDNTSYVAISDADRNAKLTYAATIHHGIDVVALGPTVDRSDYLLFFGRIHPHKGTAEAIEVARRCGRRLIIAGLVQDESYFRDEVEPHLDGHRVKYIGLVEARNRAAVLGGAYALLHLIDFDEPFGFSVIEAMACGTPVIAYRRGSMPELIDHGVTGFLATNADEAIHAVELVGGIDREALRINTRIRFSSKTMVAKYVEVYRRVLAKNVLV